MPRSAEALARQFHEAYERLAPTFSYQTRKASAVPWPDVPENNQHLMIAVAGEILAWLDHGQIPAALLDAAYRERAHLVAHLARMYEAHWSVDEAEPEWPVICIHTPAGQLCWHVNRADMNLFPSTIEERPSDWDGHTTEEKYARLAQLGA